MALPVMDRFSSPHYRWISRAKIFVLGVKYDACETCEIRTATDIRIGCCEREPSLSAGVNAAIASTARHHRPLLHRAGSATWKKTHAAAALRKTRSMAWCEAAARSGRRRGFDLRAFAAIQRQPLALDDLTERHFGCDGVANSQLASFCRETQFIP
jgi:hypothetical protein